MDQHNINTQVIPPPPINDHIERLNRNFAETTRDIDEMKRMVNSLLRLYVASHGSGHDSFPPRNTATWGGQIPPLAQIPVQGSTLFGGCPRPVISSFQAWRSTDQPLSPAVLVEDQQWDSTFDLPALPPPFGDLYSVCSEIFMGG